MNMEWIRGKGVVFKNSRGVYLDPDAPSLKSYGKKFEDTLRKIGQAAGGNVICIADVQLQHFIDSGVSLEDIILAAVKFDMVWFTLWEYAKRSLLDQIMTEYDGVTFDDMPIESLQLIGINKKLVAAIKATGCEQVGDLFVVNDKGENDKLLKLQQVSAFTFHKFCKDIGPFIKQDQLEVLMYTAEKYEEIKKFKKY